MEPKLFKELLDQAYTTPNTNGELSKLLSQVQDTYESIYAEKLTKEKEHGEISQTNQELNEMNEKLRTVNMDLFLKVGSTKNPAEPMKPQQEEKPVPITEKYE